MRLFDPNVAKYLIADEGEVVVDEVEKHWTASIKPILELIAAIPVLLLILWLPSWAYWLPLLGAPILVVHALWRILEEHLDRFVITNMRVFRVHGILSQHIATMPLARILDISVRKPVIGRVLGFGHFIFESAAQDQGLREIKFVGRPDERGLTIQRVIQRAGLRGGGMPMSAQQAVGQGVGQAAAQAATAPVQQAAPVRMPRPEPVREEEPWSDRSWRGDGRATERRATWDNWGESDSSAATDVYDRDEARFVQVRRDDTEPIPTVDPDGRRGP